MYISVNLKCPLSCHILLKLELSEQIFEKTLNIKFHEHPSCGSRTFRADRKIERETDRERERDMKKVIVVLHHFANTPKNTLNYEITQIFAALSVCRS